MIVKFYFENFFQINNIFSPGSEIKHLGVHGSRFKDNRSRKVNGEEQRSR